MENEDIIDFLEPFYKFLRIGIEEKVIINEIMRKLRLPALELAKVEMQNLSRIGDGG